MTKAEGERAVVLLQMPRRMYQVGGDGRPWSSSPKRSDLSGNNWHTHNCV
jgi:hypothetical protein